MVAERNEDLDVIGIADDELEAAVQVFFVRKGRVVGRKGFILDKVEDSPPAGSSIASSRRCTATSRRPGVPEAGARPSRSATTSATYEEWLCHLRGSKVQIRVPQRGDKRALHETVTRNAREEFVRHRLRRAGDHNARSRALTELQDLLGCPRRRYASSATTWRTSRAPTTSGRWWCSRTGCRTSASTAGSRSRTSTATTTSRRWRRCSPAGCAPTSTSATSRWASAGQKPGKFAYPPQLLLVDGGKGQLSVAERVVQSTSAWPTRSRSPRWPSASRRSTCPGRSASRSRCRGGARRCSCCSASATRRTASPTRSTASCAASG
jgi:excinuclease ABC subunit C